MVSEQLRDGTDLYVEQVRFGKEEQQRRKDSPVHVDGDAIARAHAEADHIVFIVDPRRRACAMASSIRSGWVPVSAASRMVRSGEVRRTASWLRTSPSPQ